MEGCPKPSGFDDWPKAEPVGVTGLVVCPKVDEPKAGAAGLDV